MKIGWDMSRRELVDQDRAWAGIAAAGRTAHSRRESDTRATPKGHSLLVCLILMTTLGTIDRYSPPKNKASSNLAPSQ